MTSSNYAPIHGDEDAQYLDVYDYDIDKLEPTVAKPFSPANTSTAGELESIEIDKAYIGFMYRCEARGSKNVRKASEW